VELYAIYSIDFQYSCNNICDNHRTDIYTALHCNLQHCTAVYKTVLQSTKLYWSLQNCIAVYKIVLQSTKL